MNNFDVWLKSHKEESSPPLDINAEKAALLTFDGYDLDFTIYSKLFPLINSFIQQELDLNFQLKVEYAQAATAKLTIVFGSYEMALDYLKRYHKDKESSSVYSACNFYIPGAKWHPAIWQDMIRYHNPDSPNHKLMRILPFAAEIEEYIGREENQESIRDLLLEKVNAEWENKFAQQYDEAVTIHDDSAENWKAKYKVKNKKRLQQNIHEKLFEHFTEVLGFSIEKKLTPSEIKIVNMAVASSRKPQSEHHAIYQQIVSRETEHNDIKIDEHYLQLKKQLTDITKENYKKRELNKSKKEIEKEIARGLSNLLSKNQSLSFIQKISSKLFYSHASKNPEAANLFFSNMMQEKEFNKYLALTPADDASLIPACVIHGENLSVEYAGYLLMKLKPNDPRAALLGLYTGCCQALGLNGENPTVYGITNPSAGFYVIYNAEGTIVSQCMAWRSVDHKSIIFDSIETHIDYREKNNQMIVDFFTYLAYHLVTDFNVESVLVGTGGETPTAIGSIKMYTPKYGYTDYGDSQTQRLIASSQLPAIHLFLQQNKDSALQQKNLKADFCNTQSIMEWCDLCSYNNIELSKSFIEYCLTLGIDENQLKQRGELFNQWRIFLDDPERVKSATETEIKYFLFANPNLIHIANHSNQSILQIVLNNQQWELVSYLLKNGADINRPLDNFNDTILHFAIQAGQVELVVLLLDVLGDDINRKNFYNMNPLHIAARFGHTEIVNLLLARGSEIDAKTNNNLDAMYFASENGHFSTVRTLLEKGSNSINNLIPTAVKFGNMEFLKFLIEEKRQKLDVKSNFLVLLAGQAGHWGITEYLLDQGCRIPTEVSMVRIFNIHWEMLQGWDQRKYNVNIELLFFSLWSDIKDDETPKTSKVINDRAKIVEWIISKGFDINYDEGKGTLLHTVVEKEYWEVTRVLLAHHAKTDICDSSGKNVLEIALTKETIPEDILEILKKERFPQLGIQLSAHGLFQSSSSTQTDKSNNTLLEENLKEIKNDPS